MAFSNATKALCLAALCALAAGLVLNALPASAGFAYKSYIVRQDSGKEILCDPYVVQKNDWVLKIFKLRGEIAQKDFSRFLRLFQRINPHIGNINTIRPGQHILIPLKVLSRSHLADDPSGVVRVPFLALSGNRPVSAPDKVASGAYQVQSGDCISKLLARRFGDVGTEGYRIGLRRFRQVNPKIQDLDRIFVGQWIELPGFEAALSGPSSVPPPSQATEEEAPADYAPTLTGMALYAEMHQQEAAVSDPRAMLKKAADLLDADLLDKGVFYFPRPGEEDLPMDMTDVPVMTLSDGRRLLFPASEGQPNGLIDAVRSHWQNASAIPLVPNTDLAGILDAVVETLNGPRPNDPVELVADGVHFTIRARWILDLPESEGLGPGRLCVTMIDAPFQRTPDCLTRFLSDRRIVIRDVVRFGDAAAGNGSSDSVPVRSPTAPAVMAPAPPRIFVRDLFQAMGLGYAQNVSITFPYAGIQVSAVSNLVTTPAGIPLFVDFEDLYGDAVQAIEKSGFRIVQIGRDETPVATVRKLLAAMDLEVQENPVLPAVQGRPEYNTTVTFPGMLIRNDNAADVLFMEMGPDPAIEEFLQTKGIQLIVLPGGRNESDREVADNRV